MQIRGNGCAVVLVSGLVLLLAGQTQALTLYAEGEAGSFGTIEESSGPTSVGPVTLPGVVDQAGRHASFDAEVDAGLVRLSARARADVGAQSVGNWNSRVKGSWEDSITFTAPGEIPGLPGVVITEGVTEGTARLVIDLVGTFLTQTSDATARSGFRASLGYGLLAPFENRCCGPKWNDFRGQVSVDGQMEGAISDPTLRWSGYEINLDDDLTDRTTEDLILDVTFVYGEAFDVIFEMTASAILGWEGQTVEELIAEALMDRTALWKGVQDVMVLVDDGAGGTTPLALPDDVWTFASSSVDYSSAIVPEPTTALLLSLGLTFLGIRSRALR